MPSQPLQSTINVSVLFCEMIHKPVTSFLTLFFRGLLPLYLRALCAFVCLNFQQCALRLGRRIVQEYKIKKNMRMQARVFVYIRCVQAQTHTHTHSETISILLPSFG